ncbi:unnamed protein product [marine sediment metagenome]|uniref:Uncharacterized protein n=1 Tax=marine sediment metagenome TaxID=412755 RepID=X1SVN0_9ZZZZ
MVDNLAEYRGLPTSSREGRFFVFFSCLVAWFGVREALQAHGLSLAHIAREHARQSRHLLRARPPPHPNVTP